VGCSRHVSLHALVASASRISNQTPDTARLGNVAIGASIFLNRLWWSSLRYDSGRLLPGVALVRRYCRAGGGGHPRLYGRNGSCKLYPLSACGLLLSWRYSRFDPVATLGGALMTEVHGIRKRNPVGAAIAVVVVLLAAVVWIWTLSKAKPSTDDASIDVEVVHIAPLVGGRIIELPIHENELVRKGDLLFRIDPVPYQINVAAAEANLDVARAALGSKRRLVSTQRWDAEIAYQQTIRAKDNLALSERTRERLDPLAAKGYVPQQQFDQAKLAAQDATTSLAQAEKQQHATEGAIDTEDAALASVRAAASAVANSRRALSDTEVRAPHDGRIVGLHISTGEVVAPSQSLFTMINTEEWFASANFRETDLERIRAGECVTVYSMIDRRQPIKGIVDSIGYGVLDEGKIDIPRAAPYVEPSLNWVRVAQRFPVRIRLENPSEHLVRLGASAIVEVAHGTACR
jgi:membrane fusion protein, multidrug efflux system